MRLQRHTACIIYPFAAVWLTDVAVVLGLQIAMAEGLLYLNSPELQYILIVAVTRMAEFMVILLVALAAGCKAGRHITVRQVAISVLFPLYSIFNVYCLLYLMQIYPSREMVLLFGVNLVLLIGLNLYFCVLVDVMSENTGWKTSAISIRSRPGCSISTTSGRRRSTRPPGS